MKSCSFTGHRRIENRHLDGLRHLLDRAVAYAYSEGCRDFYVGGAVGFDTLAALKVLERRASCPEITLELCLPCRNQTDGWGERSREYYDYILSQADRVEYLFDDYVKGCMLARNRRLVDGSQFCIGYCNSDRGGSAYTLDYAKKRGLRVINLARMLPND